MAYSAKTSALDHCRNRLRNCNPTALDRIDRDGQGQSDTAVCSAAESCEERQAQGTGSGAATKAPSEGYLTQECSTIEDCRRRCPEGTFEPLEASVGTMPLGTYQNVARGCIAAGQSQVKSASAVQLSPMRRTHIIAYTLLEYAKRELADRIHWYSLLARPRFREFEKSYRVLCEAWEQRLSSGRFSTTEKLLRDICENVPEARVALRQVYPAAMSFFARQMAIEPMSGVFIRHRVFQSFLLDESMPNGFDLADRMVSLHNELDRDGRAFMYVFAQELSSADLGTDSLGHTYASEMRAAEAKMGSTPRGLKAWWFFKENAPDVALAVVTGGAAGAGVKALGGRILARIAARAAVKGVTRGVMARVCASTTAKIVSQRIIPAAVGWEVGGTTIGLVRRTPDGESSGFGSFALQGTFGELAIIVALSLIAKKVPIAKNVLMGTPLKGHVLARGGLGIVSQAAGAAGTTGAQLLIAGNDPRRFGKAYAANVETWFLFWFGMSAAQRTGSALQKLMRWMRPAKMTPPNPAAPANVPTPGKPVPTGPPAAEAKPVAHPAANPSVPPSSVLKIPKGGDSALWSREAEIFINGRNGGKGKYVGQVQRVDEFRYRIKDDRGQVREVHANEVSAILPREKSGDNALNRQFIRTRNPQYVHRSINESLDGRMFLVDFTNPKLISFLERGAGPIRDALNRGRITPQDAAVKAYEFVRDNVRYNHARAGWRGELHNLGEFTDGAVCNGQAQLLQIMLQYLGLESRMVKGYFASAGRHAWVHVTDPRTGQMILDPAQRAWYPEASPSFIKYTENWVDHAFQFARSRLGTIFMPRSSD